MTEKRNITFSPLTRFQLNFNAAVPDRGQDVDSLPTLGITTMVPVLHQRKLSPWFAPHLKIISSS